MAIRVPSKTFSFRNILSLYVTIITGYFALRRVNAQPQNCECQPVYVPVCAGGKTYNNSCWAKCDNLDSTPGACDAPRPPPPPRRDCNSVICPALFDPVCGVDNGNYDNICLAACVGVEVKYRGECGTPFAPMSPETPPSVVISSCDNCPQEYRPMCGSDGTTYNNVCYLQCAAASSGVTLDYIGRCADPASCARVQCSSTYAPVCGANGRTYANRCLASCTGVTIVQTGVCGPADCECPDTFEPVCGRDGKTYDNSCRAAFCAGVGVSYFGPCANDDSGCSAVLCPAVYSPVCGNDNATYDNSCLAACANVAVLKRGPCDEPSYRYNFNFSTCACSDIRRPVCGTDGQTYDNPCKAVKCANVSVAYEGACEDAVACASTLCSSSYDPLCGLNGKEYNNICSASCAGVAFQPGACRILPMPRPPQPPRPPRPTSPPRPSPPPKPPSPPPRPPPPSPRPPRPPPSPRPPRPPPRRSSPPPPAPPVSSSPPPRRLSPGPLSTPPPVSSSISNRSPAAGRPPVTSMPPAVPTQSMSDETVDINIGSSPLAPAVEGTPPAYPESPRPANSAPEGPAPAGASPVPQPDSGSDSVTSDCSLCDSDLISFVCGTDGYTYQNACLAECMAVQIVDPHTACRYI